MYGFKFHADKYLPLCPTCHHYVNQLLPCNEALPKLSVFLQVIYLAYVSVNWLSGSPSLDQLISARLTHVSVMIYDGSQTGSWMI